MRDGANWYAYCSNNPLNRIDPTGLREILEGDPNSGMFTVTADANSDSGYHIVEGGDRYRNSVEVDIANTMITGDERWINSSDDILSNIDAMNVTKTINTVANMTFGKDSISYARQQGVYLALFALGAGGVTNNRTNFVVSPGGTVIPVPNGASGPGTVRNGKGFSYTGGTGGFGFDDRVTGVRIMDPVPRYPNGYASYMNYNGQTVSPFSGDIIPRWDPLAHIPLK